MKQVQTSVPWRGEAEGPGSGGTTGGTESRTRREMIIEAAAQLFRANGYERTTVREIAAMVGVQSGSLFHYFRNKEDLLVSVMEEAGRRALERLETVLAAAVTPVDKLHALVRGHLQGLLVDDPDAMAVMLREWGSISPAGQARLVTDRDAYESRFAAVLADCAAAGLVPSDDHLYRLFLLGGLNWTIQWFHDDGNLSVDELASRIVTLLLWKAGTPVEY